LLRKQGGETRQDAFHIICTKTAFGSPKTPASGPPGACPRIRICCRSGPRPVDAGRFQLPKMGTLPYFRRRSALIVRSRDLTGNRGASPFFKPGKSSNSRRFTRATIHFGSYLLKGLSSTARRSAIFYLFLIPSCIKCIFAMQPDIKSEVRCAAIRTK
jgi:hypothetical protein